MQIRVVRQRKSARLKWHEVSSVLLLITFCLGVCWGKSRGDQVLRAELVSLQKETGLSLAYFGWYVGTIDFAHRKKLLSAQHLPRPAGNSQNGDISPHGTMIAFAWSYATDASGKSTVGLDASVSRLGIVQTNGTGLREFPAITGPKYFCWSPDESKLAIYTFVHNASQTSDRLLVMNLRAGGIEEIATGPAFLTPQCWSPDGRSLVYGISELGDEHRRVGKVAIYDFAEKRSKILGAGVYPTWSTDGNWIAFLDGEEYYLIHSSGGDRELFLHAMKPSTGLLWSPDGRFVAYGLCCKYGGGTTLWRFYVRRLRDNAEDWVADIGDLHGVDVHWVQPVKAEKTDARGPEKAHSL